MKRSLIFHVGLQKTGTSSIQLMLAGSKKYLLSQGIIFPQLPNASKHKGIWLSPFRHNILAGTYADYSSAFPVMDEQEQVAFWNSLAEDESDIILSAEDFSRQNDFSCYADHFSSFDVELVMYVRRQDLFIESLYNQRNKILVERGDPNFLSEDFLTEADVFQFIKQQKYLPILNFPKRLDHIRKQLSPKTVHTRVFDRERLKGRDVCTDFAGIFGWDIGKMSQPEREANGSISNSTLLALKQTFLRDGPEAAKIKIREINAARANGQDFSGSYTIFRTQTRSDILRQYKDINLRLSEAYGVEFV